MKIVIEIDGRNNQQHVFLPAQRTLRGRFDALRLRHDRKAILWEAFPEGIPGMHVSIDAETGTGRITDPLNARHPDTLADGLFRAGRRVHQAILDKFGEVMRRRVEDVERSVEGDREYPGQHAPTWAYWMLRAVDAGHARLVEGRFDPKGYPDAKRDLSRPKHADPRDKQIADLTAAVLALVNMSDAERKAVAKQYAGAGK